MIALGLPAGGDAPLNVLCLGAHADDIEIGCGGTLLQLLADRPNVHVTWVVFSAAALVAIARLTTCLVHFHRPRRG